MTKILFIGMGGFVGSTLRYIAGDFVHKFYDKTSFPLGTLFVNLLGCFLIGFFGGIFDGKDFLSQEVKLLIFIGLLGGFTTFSTFGYETFNLIKDDKVIKAAFNIGLHITLSVWMVWMGNFLSRFATKVF